MRAMGRWRSEEMEDGVRCHACHGKEGTGMKRLEEG